MNSFLLRLYNIILCLFAGLGWPVWLPLVLSSAKRRQVFWQRLGMGKAFKRFPRFRHRPIWVHALSVGEVAAARPLIAHLQQRWPDQPIVCSVSTVTGMTAAQKILDPRGVFLFYFPWDLPGFLPRVLRRLNPQRVILVESDVWPNLVQKARAGRIPISLVNARLSERSCHRFQQFKAVARLLYGGFDVICTQTAQDVSRFASLGISSKQLHVCGNLKFDQADSFGSAGERQQLRRRLGVSAKARILVAGSTHAGEEALLLPFLKQLLEQFSALNLILVPRDPRRATEILEQVRALQLPVSLLSTSRSETPFRVLVVDRIGWLQSLYGVAEIAIIGGSFIDYGGHNPLEAVYQEIPVICGPYMGDFGAIMPILQQARAIHALTSVKELHSTLQHLLLAPQQARNHSQTAARQIRQQAGVARRMVDVMVSYDSE